MRNHRVLVAATLAIALAATNSAAAELRIIAPKSLEPGADNLVWIESRDGGPWQLADPRGLTVNVSRAAEFVADPAGRLMNPITVRAADHGHATIIARQVDTEARLTLPVADASPRGRFTATIEPRRRLHTFRGFGGGVMFYDNQWELSRGDDMWQKCFVDMPTRYLHLLIRPDYEPANDNDDWRTLEPAGFDFAASDRALGIARKALELRDELEIYVSLYTPPAWMKTNGSTAGQGSLKSGDEYAQELAEYVYAYLRYAKGKYAIDVDYLALFNEPDWPHTQDGMHFDDWSELVDVFDRATEALQELVRHDGALVMPALVFPDTLGSGSMTRSQPASEALRKHRQMLSERVAVWGVHDYWNTGGYWATRFDELRALPAVGKKPIWLTEWAGRNPRGDLASGTEYAEQVLNAMRLGAEAWMVFEFCHPSGNQSGLISCDWGAEPPREKYWTSHAYDVFKQLAITTGHDAQVVAMTGQTDLAGINDRSLSPGEAVEYVALAQGDSLVIHIVNPQSAPMPVELTINELRPPLNGVTSRTLAPHGIAPPKWQATYVNSRDTQLATILPAHTVVSVTVPLVDAGH